MGGSGGFAELTRRAFLQELASFGVNVSRETPFSAVLLGFCKIPTFFACLRLFLSTIFLFLSLRHPLAPRPLAFLTRFFTFLFVLRLLLTVIFVFLRPCLPSLPPFAPFLAALPRNPSPALFANLSVLSAIVRFYCLFSCFLPIWRSFCPSQCSLETFRQPFRGVRVFWQRLWGLLGGSCGGFFLFGGHQRY